jgi:hypothetical protein
MVKVKFFMSGLDAPSEFEEQIQEFLTENPNIQIVELKYNCNMIPIDRDDGYDGLYSALLFYK